MNRTFSIGMLLIFAFVLAFGAMQAEEMRNMRDLLDAYRAKAHGRLRSCHCPGEISCEGEGEIPATLYAIEGGR
jgi:hypothetical protein